MVFDEIDTGIGGRAADAVGKKLKALAWTAQVLCVTHLPQIAAFADQHYSSRKRRLVAVLDLSTVSGNRVTNYALPRYARRAK